MPLAQATELFGFLPRVIGGGAFALLGQYRQGHNGAEILQVARAPEALIEAGGLDLPLETNGGLDYCF